MSRIVLDTSAYSHLRRGEEHVINAVSEADVVYLPTTVLGELEAGFRIGHRFKENQRALAEFVAESFVEVIDINAEVARRYGELFARLRRAGTPIPVNDIWIAAAAITVGAELLTFDSDFDRVSGLSLRLL